MKKLNLIRFAMMFVALAFVGLSVYKTSDAVAYPKPKLVSPSYELNFYYDAPRILIHRSPGDLKARRYVYMTYRVVNRSGADRMFVPKIDMITGTGQLLRAGQNLGADVFDKVRDESRIPMLQTNSQIVGKLNTGRDNTKYGVAIFALPDVDVDSFTIFITGLSGEAEIVTPEGSDKEEMMFKTLMLSFEAPGDNKTLNLNLKPIKNTDQRWIMR